LKNSIFTHNHSNNSSLSPGDLLSTIQHDMHQMRATSPKYLHTLTRPKGGWNVPHFWKSKELPGAMLGSEYGLSLRKNWQSLNFKIPFDINRFKDTNVYTQFLLAEATNNTLKELSKKYGFIYVREVI